MVLCPKCGFDNELGRIFCHKCGTKLDLHEVRPMRASGKERWGKQNWSVKRVIGLVIRLAILAGVVLAIALILQVPPAREIKWTDGDARGIDRKRLELERMIQQQKAGTITLSGAEIDAYIGQMTFEAASSRLDIEPATVQIELGHGDVTVVVVGKIKFGKVLEKLVAFRYTGVPTIEGGRFVFQPTGGDIGRMPIHPIILHSTGFLGRYYAALFRDLSNDRELLNTLAAISVDPQRGVELKYDPVARR